MIWLYSVVSNEVVAHNSSLVTLKTNGSALDFRPGQYIYVSGNGHNEVKRPYSIMSLPSDKNLQLLIKYFYNYQQADLWVPGTDVYVEGPYGDLSYINAPEHSQIWLAGGAGIAPFISMARILKKSEKHVTLHWFVNEAYQLDSMRDVAAIAERLGPSTFMIEIHKTHEGGWDFGGVIYRNREPAAILVSGSPRMKVAVADAVAQNGHKGTVLWDIEGDPTK